jgi:hypothetical protein
MVLAECNHLTFNKVEFQPQSPSHTTINKHMVVIISGIVLIILNLGLVTWAKYQVGFGLALLLFFDFVILDAIAKHLYGKDEFEALRSDEALLNRLFFQPVLIDWVLCQEVHGKHGKCKKK